MTLILSTLSYKYVSFCLVKIKWSLSFWYFGLVLFLAKIALGSLGKMHRSLYSTPHLIIYFIDLKNS